MLDDVVEYRKKFKLQQSKKIPQTDDTDTHVLLPDFSSFLLDVNGYAKNCKCDA